MTELRTVEPAINDAAHSPADKLRAHSFLLLSPTPLGAVYREQVRRVKSLMQKIQEAVQ